eukprot:3719548-Amphidinium_carterae.2
MGTDGASMSVVTCHHTQMVVNGCELDVMFRLGTLRSTSMVKRLIMKRPPMPPPPPIGLSSM